jgi:hypothetical protein
MVPISEPIQADRLDQANGLKPGSVNTSSRAAEGAEDSAIPARARAASQALLEPLERKGEVPIPLDGEQKWQHAHCRIRHTVGAELLAIAHVKIAANAEKDVQGRVVASKANITADPIRPDELSTPKVTLGGTFTSFARWRGRNAAVPTGTVSDSDVGRRLSSVKRSLKAVFEHILAPCRAPGKADQPFVTREPRRRTGSARTMLRNKRRASHAKSNCNSRLCKDLDDRATEVVCIHAALAYGPVTEGWGDCPCATAGKKMADMIRRRLSRPWWEEEELKGKGWHRRPSP